jgi:D-alanyl-D-alanine carboxypeptidase/D-alanyl-D-alanine-endopeptidase (penicillin-binding protein 4)
MTDQTDEKQLRRWLTRASAIAVLCLLGISSPLAADDKPSPQIREAIDAPRFQHAQWGILVADRGTGEVIYELNADKLFAPASTAKLYSVAAALDALGKDHCFETPVYCGGTVDATGTLEGDLILVASGDLTLGGRTTPKNEIEFTKGDHTYANPSGEATLTAGDPLAGLNRLAQQIAAAGIRRVRGQILIDARLFDPASATGSGPSQLTPILVNDNVIDISITPTTKGAPAKVDWRPRSASLAVDAQVETIAAGGATKIDCRSAGDDRLIVRGRIAADRARFVSAQEVGDPAKWARSLFIEALERTGVSVSASAYESNPADLLPKPGDYTGLTRVAALQSPPFSENARLILKVSHNLHASMLPLLIAVHHGKRRLEDGLRLQHDFLKRAGLDADSISFAGGAGGAQADYTSPRMTVALLRYMAARPDFAVYERALPILGVDGTIANDVAAGSPARGKVRAKSGTLFWDNVMNGHFVVTSKALAGYLTAKSGRELAFSFVVSNAQIDKAPQTKEIAKVLGHLCEIVQDAH